MHMKPEVKERWIAALRSGDYQQTQGALVRTGDHGGYCCLGVLCQLAVEDGVIPPKSIMSAGSLNDPTDVDYYYGNDESRSSNYLPTAVIEWAGLDKSVLERHAERHPALKKYETWGIVVEQTDWEPDMQFVKEYYPEAMEDNDALELYISGNRPKFDLAEENDNDGSFDYIAGLVEKYL